MSGNSTFIPHGGIDPVTVEISSGDFWPQLDSNEFRDIMRVDGTVPNIRVEAVLIAANLRVNRELRPFAAKWAEAQTMASIPADQINGQSVYVLEYRAAVFNEAKADLTERYRDYDSTNDGHDEADKLESNIEDYRRKAREAIRAILDQPRATVELL